MRTAAQHGFVRNATVTPATAAGVTDHVWEVEESWRYREAK